MTTFSDLIKSITSNSGECEDSLSLSSYSSDFPTCLEFNSFPDTMEIPDSSTQIFMLNELAFLSIENEFKQQIRFRYKSEKGKHGGVKPIIKLHNYEDDHSDVFIKASLYAADKEEKHVFELSGNDCKNGFGWKKLGSDSTAKFSTLSICAKKRDEALKILLDRQNGNQPESIENLQAKLKSMKDSVRFCFEAFVDEKLICEKIFSQPISDQRNTSELKIIRINPCSGKAAGDVDMILLCDKISKDETEIWFFEEDESGDIIWEAQAKFQKADVHFQVAIPFKTPAYNGDNIKENVEVFIQLRKISGERGKAVKFTYLENTTNSCKRKRQDLIDNLGNFIASYDLALSADYEDLPKCSNPYLYKRFREDMSQSNLQIDAIITAGMAALDLTSLKKRSINLQSFHELKSKITSLLLNKDDSSFLKLFPCLLMIQDSDCNSLLHLITMEENCDSEFLELILQFAPKNLVNISNNSKMTPLHISASQGHIKGIQILMQHGANPNLKNIDGNNCIHLAVANNQPKCLEELIKPSFDERHFGQNYINASNNDGLTALHMAVLNESFICTKILISHKASFNIPDGKSFKTAIHFALEKNSEIRTYLLTQMIENDESFSPSESEEERELQDINREIETKLCSILDSNGLWKKMGLYIMDENEIDVIAALQDNPTKIILKELKKRHEKNYFEKLKNIMTNDLEFKPIAKQLLLMH